jgi:hypothetical protein
MACRGAKGQGEKERQDPADCAVHRFLDTRALLVQRPAPNAQTVAEKCLREGNPFEGAE